MTALGKLDVADRFDGAAAWAALPDDARAAIGAAVLEMEAAESLWIRGLDEADARLARVGLAALEAAGLALKRVVSDLPGTGLDTAAGQPRIPSLLGMVCQDCGCSEQRACPQGCGWARDSLCTVCAARAADRAA